MKAGVATGGLTLLSRSGFSFSFLETPKVPAAMAIHFEEHEMDHVNSLTGSCHSIASRYQSEGFSNQGECEDALEKFLADLDREFLDAIDSEAI
jgi:hypothetical protein